MYWCILLCLAFSHLIYYQISTTEYVFDQVTLAWSCTNTYFCINDGSKDDVQCQRGLLNPQRELPPALWHILASFTSCFFLVLRPAKPFCNSLEHLAAKEPDTSLSGRHFPVCGGEQNRALKEEWKLDLHVSSKTQMNSDVALCLLCK